MTIRKLDGGQQAGGAVSGGAGEAQQQQPTGTRTRMQSGDSPFGGNGFVRQASTVGFNHDLTGAGVWDRMASITKAWTSKILDTAEDPQVMLASAKTDMQATLPKLNGLVQRAEAAVTVISNKLDAAKAALETATTDARTAKADNAIPRAEAIIKQRIVPGQEEVTRLQGELTRAQGNAAKAQQTRDAVGNAIREKIAKATQIAEASKSDHLKTDIADALQSLDQYSGKAAQFDAAVAKASENSAIADAALTDAMRTSGAMLQHEIDTARQDKKASDILANL